MYYPAIPLVGIGFKINENMPTQTFLHKCPQHIIHIIQKIKQSKYQLVIG